MAIICESPPFPLKQCCKDFVHTHQPTLYWGGGGGGGTFFKSNFHDIFFHESDDV